MIINQDIGNLGHLRYTCVPRNAKNLSRVCSWVPQSPHGGVLTTARAEDQYSIHGLSADAATHRWTCQGCLVLRRFDLTQFRHSYIPVALRAALAGLNLFTSLVPNRRVYLFAVAFIHPPA